MKKYLPILLLLVSFTAKAQFLSVYDLDKSNYPEIKAKFVATDAKGRQIFDLQKSEVTITENDKSAEVIRITNSKPAPPQPISAVLTLDVSGSMTGENIEISKAAATVFVNMLSLDVSECAITSFDHANYFNSDFSQNPNRLREAIKGLDAKGGTDYNVAFTQLVAGAFRVAESGKNRKIVVFLTDGLGTGNQEEIIRQAKEQNITVYCITIALPIPEILKQVAIQTGGLWFENITQTSQAENAYLQILQNAQKGNFGQIVWKAPLPCSTAIEYSIVARSLKNTGLYEVDESRIAKLDIKPSFLRFRNTELGKPEQLTVTLKAQNTPISISAAINNNGSLFVLAGETFPVTIEKNKSRTLTLTYTPADSSLNFCRINFENNLCQSDYLYASAGLANKRKLAASSKESTLKLVSPNGGEIFAAGSDTIIAWTGCNQDEKMKLSYSSDNGITWNLIEDDVCGFKYRWTTPLDTGTNYKIKISQKILNDVTNGKNSKKRVRFNAYNYGSSYLYDAIFSPNGILCITRGSDFLVKLWDINGQLIKVIEKNSNEDIVARFSPNGNYIYIINGDGTAKLYDVNGKHLQTFSGLQTENYNFEFSPDETMILTSGEELIHYSNYDILPGGIYKFKEGTPAGTHIYSSGSKYVYSAKLWDMNGKVLHTFDSLCYNGSAIFSPDGSRILTENSDSTVKLWEINGNLLQSFKSSRQGGRPLFSPDGSQFLTCEPYFAKLWDLNGNLLQTYKLPSSYNYAFFSRDGSLILIDSQNLISLWDNKGHLLHSYKNSESYGTNGGFSPDGSQLFISSDEDSTINLFDLDGTLLQTFKGIKDLWRVKYSPDGTQILVDGLYNATLLDIVNSINTLQEDNSDSCFSIISPKPVARDVVFGKQIVGKPTDKLIDGFLTNTYNLASYIQKIEIKGEHSSDFSVISGFPPYAISAGKSRKIEFRFTPSVAGERKAQVYVITPQDTVISNIQGTGITQQFEIINKLVDFGKVKTGSSRDTTIVLIKNIGTEPFQISNIINAGPDKQQFTVANPDNVTLKSSEEHSLKFTFKPVQRGRTSTSISFKINDFPEMQQVALLGEGDAPYQVTLLGTVLDAKYKKPLISIVRCYDLYYNSMLKELRTESDGKFEYTLPVDRSYSITAECDSFITGSESIDLTGLILFETINRDILLSKIEAGVTVRLNNIFFEFNKAELSDVSAAELNRVFDLLIKNPTMQIEIAGHTDNKGSAAYNNRLSQERANSVRNYLIGKEIVASRLVAKGYGMTKPMDTNSTDEGRQQNRRVEFSILKK